MPLTDDDYAELMAALADIRETQRQILALLAANDAGDRMVANVAGRALDLVEQRLLPPGRPQT